MFVIISHISCFSVSLSLHSGCRAIFMKHYNIICICGAIIQFLFVWSPPPIQIDKINDWKKKAKRRRRRTFGDRFFVCFVCGFRLWGFVHLADVGFVTSRECASMSCMCCWGFYIGSVEYDSTVLCNQIIYIFFPSFHPSQHFSQFPPTRLRY